MVFINLKQVLLINPLNLYKMFEECIYTMQA